MGTVFLHYSVTNTLTALLSTGVLKIYESTEFVYMINWTEASFSLQDKAISIRCSQVTLNLPSEYWLVNWDTVYLELQRVMIHN
jgi:hypothetical protein